MLQTKDKVLLLHTAFSVWHGLIIFLSSSFAAFKKPLHFLAHLLSVLSSQFVAEPWEPMEVP